MAPTPWNIPMRTFIFRFSLPALLLLQSCSDLGADPTWSSWPHYGYRQLEYALPPLQGSVGPTPADSNGIWMWSSDSTESLWIQFVYTRLHGSPYCPGAGDRAIPISSGMFSGMLYIINVGIQDRWYLMVHFPRVGEGGYQFVLYANGPKGTPSGEMLRSLADQIIRSITFHPRG